MTGYLIFTLILLSIWTPLAMLVAEAQAEGTRLTLLGRFVLVFWLPLIITIYLMETVEEGSAPEGTRCLREWWYAVVKGREYD